MRREIASKLRRAASVLRTVRLWASLALWLAIAATALIVVLAVGLAAYFAFGWLGVGAVAVFVLIVFFGKDPPTEQTGPRSGLVLVTLAFGFQNPVRISFKKVGTGSAQASGQTNG